MGAELRFSMDVGNVEKQCADCGRKVMHRPVSVSNSLFDSVTLWRPVRHCPKCGFISDLQEDTPGQRRLHVADRSGICEHSRLPESEPETVAQ